MEDGYILNRPPPNCPHCEGFLRAPSMSEMKKYILEQVGFTGRPSGSPIIKAELVAIYQFIKTIEEQEKSE